MSYEYAVRWIETESCFDDWILYKVKSHEQALLGADMLNKTRHFEAQPLRRRVKKRVFGRNYPWEVLDG